MENNDVCIGVITSGQVHMSCTESLLAVVLTKVAKWVFFKQSGPYLDDARNSVVEIFLNTQFNKCKYLLMVDSDIEFRPEHITQLVEDDVPIVSGVYMNAYNNVLKPVVYQWNEVPTIVNRPDRRFKSGFRAEEVMQRTMTPIDGWDDDDERALVPADGCGAGFLMIRRDVLLEMPHHFKSPTPWFAEETYFGTHFGEDLCFNIRAAELGYTTMIDRRVQLAHHKQVRLVP